MSRRPRRCVVCREPIAQPATGRPRRTCSDVCRKRLQRRKPAGRAYTLRANSVEWRTPLSLFRSLDAQYGPFTLDAAATADNALVPAFFTLEDDALTQEWAGAVWVNPPYGPGIADWVAKARASVESGTARVVVLLVPARTDTRSWHQHVAGRAEVEFLPGRVCFKDSNGVSGCAPFASVVVVFRD